MPRPNEAAFLRSVLQNNESAATFCEALFRISQTLDDLIDKDRDLDDQIIISAFWKALIELPANPFYREHEPYLRPLMAASLQDWRDSVKLERSNSQHSQTIAFVLRDQLTSVVVQCAYLVGGESWMESVGPQIRGYFHSEPLSDYLNDLQEK